MASDRWLSAIVKRVDRRVMCSDTWFTRAFFRLQSTSHLADEIVHVRVMRMTVVDA